MTASPVELSVLDDCISPKFRAGILGATGTVGQNFALLLADHAWIKVVALGASERSAGQKYADAWSMPNALCPKSLASLTIWDAVHDRNKFIESCDLIFSALDNAVAYQTESDLAAAGLAVFSNAAAHRYEMDVPIVVPSVNAEHLKLCINQGSAKSGGFVVTNSNCLTAGLVTCLKPLHASYGLQAVICTSLQAVSGAGMPGPTWNAIANNVIPDIPKEEFKIETETLKILGDLDPSGRINILNDLPISASVTRVPVDVGHTISVSVKLANPPLNENSELDCEAISETFNNYKSEVPDIIKLPTMPSRIIRVFSKIDEPQPKFHSLEGGGMTVCVGKIRPCNVLTVKFNVVVNNAILGAAGGSVVNAELAIACNVLR